MSNTPPPSTAYSGKPLAQKLGIKAGTSYALIGVPEGFTALAEGVPAEAELLPPERAMEATCVLLFAPDTATLAEQFPTLAAIAPVGGMLWVAWPKKASGVPTDLTEDRIRDLCLPTGWVDVKVCAVDAIWSGLKFLRRRV